MKKIILMFLFLAPVIAFSQTSTNSPTALEVVQKFLTSYQKKDHAGFVSVLDSSITWFQPGSNAISGKISSLEQLLKFGATMSKLTGKTLTLEKVEYFEGSGEDVSCLMHWKGKNLKGETLDIRNVDVYKVSRGKITEARIFSEDLLREDQFWGKL